MSVFNKGQLFIQFCILLVGANCVRPRETAGLPYGVRLRRLRHRHLRRVQHIFNENTVARGGVVDEHVGDRSDELAVLDYR